MGWGPFRQPWVFPVAILLAGAGFLLITRYYNDNYGRVTPEIGQLRAVGGSILSVLVMGGGPVLVQVLDLPVNGLAASFALVAVGYYAVSVGLKAQHVVIWGSVLVFALIPVWGDPATTNTMNDGLLAVGAAAIATGIFDHRQLVRIFGSTRDVNQENSHVGG